MNIRFFAGISALAILSALGSARVTAEPPPPLSTTRMIPLTGGSFPQTGTFIPSGDSDATRVEFRGQLESGGRAPYAGRIVNRSLSAGSGNGVSVNSGHKAKSNPTFNTSFEGLNAYQQRYSRGGNQVSLEPPDQALCAGNGYVIEAVNVVLNIFNNAGQSVLPDNTATNIVAGFPRNVNHAIDLNSFYGYPPEINRATGIAGPFLTDPSCLYDVEAHRFFVVVLTLETLPDGSFTNHLDLAVSQTPNPTAGWNIYRVDVTNDGGSNPSPSNSCPCLGDYPHIGADAYGLYITTNAYPLLGNGFNGAQIYAFSKAQLAAGASSVRMVHIDTFGAVNVPSDAGSTQPGFTVWPAQSPARQHRDGTEYFLSSNAADEATRPVSGVGGPHTSNQIILWTLTKTSSLNTPSPALNLANDVLTVNQYAIPPRLRQPGSGTPATTDTPLGYCINNTTTLLFNGRIGCWRLLFGAEPAHNEVISRPDPNDTRMQQVMYANGKLWGALDTALNPDGGGQRAGIAWYIINPNSGKLVLQGYLGAAGHDFNYPAIGVTASGRGVMTFTATGDTLNPSGAYVSIDAIIGVGPWAVVPGGEGQVQDDGLTSYTAFGNPPDTRWGDYSAAAVDGNSIWIAGEYVSHRCSYIDWGGPFFAGGTGDNLLGTCGGVNHGPGARTAFMNWSTRVSNFIP